jgi:hypothetical protein
MDISGTFNKFGFELSKFDEGLFFFRSGSTFIILALWVDDFAWVSNDNEKTEEILVELRKCYVVKETDGKLLGMELNYEKDGISITQTTYIEDKVKEFGLEDAKAVWTPMVAGQILERNSEEMKKLPYREILGSLMHAMISTRPDIAFTVGVLSRFADCYGEIHWTAAKRCLKYLHTTKRLGLKYHYGSDVNLLVYADADYGGCRETGRSTTGYTILLGGTAICWRSTKQKIVTLSTAEAEIVAASEAARQTIWIRNMLEELGFNQGNATEMMEDNNACIRIATKPESRSRTRHISLKYHYIQEQVEEGTIKMKRCDTTEMAADILTKAVPRSVLEKLVKFLGMQEIQSLGGVLDSSHMSGRTSYAAALAWTGNHDSSYESSHESSMAQLGGGRGACHRALK